MQFPKVLLLVAMTAVAHADGVAVVTAFIDDSQIGSDVKTVKNPYGSVVASILIDGSTGDDNDRTTATIEVTQRWEHTRKAFTIGWTVDGSATRNTMEYDDNGNPCRHIIHVQGHGTYQTTDTGTVSDIRVSKKNSISRFIAPAMELESPIDYSISESGCHAQGSATGTFDGGDDSDYDPRFSVFYLALLKGGGTFARIPSFSEKGTLFKEAVFRAEADGSIEQVGGTSFIESTWNGEEVTGTFHQDVYDGRTLPIWNNHNPDGDLTQTLRGTISLHWALFGTLKCEGEPSGPQWRGRYNDSSRLNDLSDAYRPKVQNFLAALHQAGVTPSINQTLRAKETGYLMHYAWLIHSENLDPNSIETFPGVNVCWMHYDDTGAQDRAAAKAAADAMVSAWDIAYAPAWPTSMHFTGDAVDMSMSWTGDIYVKDASGTAVPVVGEPRTGGRSKDEAGNQLPSGDPRRGGHPMLVIIGGSYGVIKLPSDPPHWSSNGN